MSSLVATSECIRILDRIYRSLGVVMRFEDGIDVIFTAIRWEWLEARSYLEDKDIKGNCEPNID